MATAQTCARCQGSLPAGLPEVFCPACALRRALAVGGLAPAETNWFVRFLRRWRTPPPAGPRDQPASAEATPHTSMSNPVPRPGDLIGDYEILESLGGHMGLVFKARHRLLEKVVALKLLPIDGTNDSDKSRRARFEREIRVMGPLEHPNLVTANDARIFESWHMVSMEWIEGVDLQRLVRSHGALPVADACEVARQAALGLEYAHAHGLIHRDVKPSNLMLTRTGMVKVIDLGLALTREESMAQLTQAGQVMGTIAYCAPEQFRDASSVDIRADIYSLGCTLFHLLTGKAPHGQRKAVTEVVQAHLNEPFPKLSASLAEVPVELEDLLARMTARDREDRFSTPAEVAAALEPFTRQADLKRLVPAKEPQAPRLVSARQLPEGRPAHRVLGMRRAAGWAAGLTAILVALGLAAALMFPRMPVVALIDTIAERGVYDVEDRAKGVSNAEELKNVLRKLAIGKMHTEAISIRAFDRDWGGEARVLSFNPDLVLIHRSCFFHPLNAEMKFGYPPDFETEEDKRRWEILYRIGDDKLIAFLSIIATALPRTKFIVYSRGTDVKWTDKDFREVTWINDVVTRCPALKDRITPVLIEGGTNGSFRIPATADDIRKHVRKALKLPE